TTTYPPLNADCNGGATDANLFCGHDSTHFWRAGDGARYTLKFTVDDTAPAPNDVGSGANPAGGTCTINGGPTCMVTFDAASGKFTFPAEFSGATFSSNNVGQGVVTVTVNGSDLVGNAPAAPVSVDVNVTRVKWVRQVGLPTISTPPLLSSTLGVVIVGAA